MISIDASRYVLGSVLKQEQEVKSDTAEAEGKKEWVTVWFRPKTFIYVKRN